MIKNLDQLLREIQPKQPRHFTKWLENRIDIILKNKHITGLLPYSSHSSYGLLSINSETNIKIGNIEVLYDI